MHKFIILIVFFLSPSLWAKSQLSSIAHSESYVSAESMSKDFAYGFCSNDYNSYLKVASYAVVNETFTIFGRNELLDALFSDSVFLNTLNECLKESENNIHNVVTYALAANVLARTFNISGLGFFSKFFVKSLAYIAKKITQHMPTQIKQITLNTQLRLKNASTSLPTPSLKTKSFFNTLNGALDSKLGLIGIGSGVLYNEMYNLPEIRNSYLKQTNKRNCVDSKLYLKHLKQDIDSTYENHKQNVNNQINLNLLEKEYQEMLLFQVEESIRLNKFLDNC